MDLGFDRMGFGRRILFGGRVCWAGEGMVYIGHVAPEWVDRRGGGLFVFFGDFGGDGSACWHICHFVCSCLFGFSSGWG